MTFPCAEDRLSVVGFNLLEADDRFSFSLLLAVNPHGRLFVCCKLIVVDVRDDIFLYRHLVLTGMIGEGHLVAVNNNI